MGKNFGGQFTIGRGTPKERVLPNTITGDGAEAYLKEIFQDLDNLPAAFYLGLTNASYTFLAAALVDIAAGEPVANGYARQALTRNNTVWTVGQVNGMMRARSAVVNFTATGLWTVEWTRAFLCSVGSGTGGVVYALTKAIEPQEVLAGEGPPIDYEFWWRQ